MTRRKNREDQRSQLPPEVHADLVETLFGTVGSFAAGIVGGLTLPVIAWSRTGEPIYLACGAGMIALAAFRLMVLLRRRRADPARRISDAPYWERQYAIGAVTYMLVIGLTSSILISRAHDQLSTLYSIVIAMGCVGAVAGRNAGRPMIVFGQVVAICLPLAVTFLFSGSAWYWGVAVLLLLILTSVKSTTRFLNGTLVAALLNGREAQIQRMRFSTALDSMSHGLCMGDASGTISVVNHRMLELFQLDPRAIDHCHASHLAELIADSGSLSPLKKQMLVSSWNKHVAARDSSVFRAEIGEGIFDFRCEPEDQGGFVVAVSDVTEAAHASREIERMAHFDSLTGLPNRAQFYSQLSKRLGEISESGDRFAVLSIDLDRFKEVNDSRGHAVGDKLLQLVGGRLRASLRSADMVARFGGDEFQVLLRIDSDKRPVVALAERVVETLSQTYSVDGSLINIGASIGIAFAPDDATAADEILRCADMALYAAKAAGRGISHAFNAEMELVLRRRQEVCDILRAAIEADGLEVHYQPVVDTRTGRIVACEALARLPHPIEGMISPGEFILVAEESGLIVKLGEWVLRRACADAVSWPEHIRVAVNFSPRQFGLGSDVAKDIKRALADTGLPPGRLEVEITESTLIDAKDSLQQLKNISDLGVKLCLDDFGTGYSSLSYLRQFPVDKIKIDSSFARDISSQASQAIIRSVAVLAKLLNVDLVVEGVEDEVQLEALTGWNVHLIQGYYYSRPRPLGDLTPVLTSAYDFRKPKLKDVA